MEKVTAPQSAAPPSREPGRRTMRIAIGVLAVSQFLPFYQGSAFMEQRRSADSRGTYENAYADKGYESYVRSGDIDIGFAAHPYAIFILPLLIALFFTRLYYRPGWSKKIYWAAIILAIGCTELPPPIDTLGGMVGAIALALMAYSLYQRSQMQRAEVRAV